MKPALLAVFSMFVTSAAVFLSYGLLPAVAAFAFMLFIVATARAMRA